jgi:hypothetical protein
MSKPNYPFIQKETFVKRKPARSCEIPEMSFMVQVKDNLRLEVRLNKSMATGYQVFVQCYSNNDIPVLEYFHNSNRTPTEKEINVFIEKFISDWRVEPGLRGQGRNSGFLSKTG